ncbi:YwiB family protein [Paenibacillus sp. strain BS8-2]
MEASGKNVVVTLESVQDGEKIIETYSGQWFRKARSVYVRYAEAEGEVRTLIKYSRGELALTRNGAVKMEQLFVAGQRRNGSYRSAMTSFQLETETTVLTIEGGGAESDENGLPSELPFTLEWSYGLLVEERLSGRFHIRLHIQEELER